MKTTYKLTYPIFLNLETSNISKLHAKFGFDRTLELTKASVVSLSFLSTIVVQPGSIKTWQFLDISYKTAPPWPHATLHASARNNGNADAKGISGIGSAVKSNTNGMSVCSRSRFNVGANNDNGNSNNSSISNCSDNIANNRDNSYYSRGCTVIPSNTGRSSNITATN